MTKPQARSTVVEVHGWTALQPRDNSPIWDDWDKSQIVHLYRTKESCRRALAGEQRANGIDKPIQIVEVHVIVRY